MKALILAALAVLAAATVQFFFFNAPIIRHDWILWGTSIVLFAAMGWGGFSRRKAGSRGAAIGLGVLGVAAAAISVFLLLDAVLFDYFQPLSLYDQVIYPSLVAYVLLILALLGAMGVAMFRRGFHVGPVVSLCAALLFLLQFGLWNLWQQDAPFTNTRGDVQHVFVAGEGDYAIYRIPAILVVPGEDTDRVLIFAEGRKHGSLDHGEVDLVMKHSDDGGRTWSDLRVVRRWEDGTGKIGNPVPIYDPATRRVVLLHIGGRKPAEYDTYQMVSEDAGASWSAPELVYDGLVGPGHGIVIKGGAFDGRLVAPGYHEGGSLSLYSDDHGTTWRTSPKLDDGNEALITQVSPEGELMMVVRTNRGVAQPHGRLHKLAVWSTDGGASWSEIAVLGDLEEPICMSSLTTSGDTVYYSHPDAYFSRSRMTVAASSDGGRSFASRRLVYSGPSGYSDVGTLSTGDLALVFENGAVEYDERLTFAIVPKF